MTILKVYLSVRIILMRRKPRKQILKKKDIS
jgi:hypothetical protein